MTFNQIKDVFDDRAEQLFVSAEYKLFVFTGQKTWECGGRNALTVRPFNSVDATTRQTLDLQSSAFVSGDNSDLTISFNKSRNCLTIIDRMVGTDIDIPLAALDQDVQDKIRQQDSFNRKPV